MPPEQLTDRLEFEDRIRNLSLEERSTFIAQQTYILVGKVDCLSGKFDALDKKFDEYGISGNAHRKVGAVSGGITGALVAIVIGIIEYFRVR